MSFAMDVDPVAPPSRKRSRPADFNATEFEPPAKRQVTDAHVSHANGGAQPMEVDGAQASGEPKKKQKLGVAYHLEPVLMSLLDNLKASVDPECFHKPQSDKLFPDYYRIVKQPMDFETMGRRIEEHAYTTLQSFADDVALIWKNAFQFYEKDTEWYEAAEKLQEIAPGEIEKAAGELGFSLNPNAKKKRRRNGKERSAGTGTDKSSRSSSLSATTANGKPKKGKRGKNKKKVEESPPREFTEEELERAGVKTLKVRKNEGYEEIHDYMFVEAKEDPNFSQLLLTSKKGCCDGEHCRSYEDLGPFDLINEHWESKCEDRHRQTECSDDCKCGDECKNKSISLNRHKRLGDEVQEQDVYGIDSYTRQQIELILPDALEELMDKDAKWKYIEEKIQPAINSFESSVKLLPQFVSKKSDEEAKKLFVAPFYFTDVLRLMLFEAEQRNDALDQQIISYTLRVCLELARRFSEQAVEAEADNQYAPDFRGQIASVKASINFEEEPWSSSVFLDKYNAMATSEAEHWLVVGEQAMCDGEFPLYSKGRGVVCIDQDGFQSNEFIVQFYGEVYPPWLWHEKSDRVRFLEKNKGYSAEPQPDFFNMLLERHKDDKDGYNLVFIDPSRKGNYASRLSHSCRPNCMAISMAAGGRFIVGVYAIREIKYGEELCFDYMSITEDEQEYLKAICLCGTKACRNYYLQYAGTGAFAELMREYQDFLHRTANMYVASTQPVTPDDQVLLAKYRLKEALFNGVPAWMKKYAAKVCEFIQFEREKLPSTLWELSQSDDEKVTYHFDNEEETQIEAAGVMHNRLQMLAISIHRVAFFLNHKNNENLREYAPLVPLDHAHLINKIWKEKDSIVRCFLQKATPHLGTDHPIVMYLTNAAEPEATSQGVKKMRRTLLEVSRRLRELEPEPNAFHHAAADLFYLYANTKHFFTTQAHRSFSSRAFTFHDLGYTRTGKAPPKQYNAQYAWGQLNFWDRQTIEKPDASLSQMRRGTVALPAISSCYRGLRAAFPKRLYNEKERDEMLEWIETKAAQPWPTKWHWGFKNGKIYGSPWLDTYIDEREKEKLEEVIQTMRSWSYPEM